MPRRCTVGSAEKLSAVGATTQSSLTASGVFLAPRIIRGESYYRMANLDRFMDPPNNVPGADLVFLGGD